VQKVVGENRNALSFLAKFLEKDFSRSMLKAESSPRYRLNHRVLEHYLDPSNLLDQVRALAGSARLSEPQAIALEQFLKIYEPQG
jgi:hypothetical protein